MTKVLAVYFRPQDLPRSMNRDQWREIWRRKRKAEAEARIEQTRQIEILRGHVIGEATAVRLAMVERLINPPLLVMETAPPLAAVILKTGPDPEA